MRWKNYLLIVAIPAMFIISHYVIHVSRVSKPYVKDDVLRLLGKSEVKTYLFNNKDVVLIFWSRHCAPCMKALPNIEAIASQCENYEFIAVSYEHLRKHPVIKYYAVKQDTFLRGLSLYLEQHAFKGSLIEVIPFYVVLNKEGYMEQYFVNSKAFITYLQRNCGDK